MTYRYGSFNVCDKAYLRGLAALLRRHLGRELVLFTTDGPKEEMQRCGALPGELLATVDFGPNKPPSVARELIARFNPRTLCECACACHCELCSGPFEGCRTEESE